MVTADYAVFWLWALITMLNVRPTISRLTRLAERGPAAMCPGCRERRRSLLLDLPELQALGPAGGAFLVLIEAGAWWIYPFEPWARRVAGSVPRPRCRGASCAAHRNHAWLA
jgi:hypothetical protein